MTTTKRLAKVFVYGTLKMGEPNHHWFEMENKGFAQFICTGKTDTKFPLIIATKYNVPFLLNVPHTGHNVHGEIYLVDDSMLSNLDELEEYPELYDRNIFNVNGSDGWVSACDFIIKNLSHSNSSNASVKYFRLNVYVWTKLYRLSMERTQTKISSNNFAIFPLQSYYSIECSTFL